MQNINFEDVPELDLGDLTPVTVRYKIRGESFVLREADADTGRAYKNAAMASTRMADGKVVGVHGMADIETLLVARCLFRVGPSGKDGQPSLMPVPERHVLGLPTRIVKQLYEKARQISDLETKPDTVEDIDRAISKLQKQRQELLAESNGHQANSEGSQDTNPTLPLLGGGEGS